MKLKHNEVVFWGGAALAAIGCGGLMVAFVGLWVFSATTVCYIAGGSLFAIGAGTLAGKSTLTEDDKGFYKNL